MLQGYRNRGGGGLGLCIFLLSSLTWSPQRKRPVWWPCGQIYLSFSGKHKLGPFQEWTLSSCARCRESHEAHMHAHLSADDSCHHHIRGTGTSMTRLRQVNYLSFWFSFCSLLLPPTSHSSNIAPLVMHKLVPFSHKQTGFKRRRRLHQPLECRFILMKAETQPNRFEVSSPHVLDHNDGIVWFQGHPSGSIRGAAALDKRTVTLSICWAVI